MKRKSLLFAVLLAPLAMLGQFKTAPVQLMSAADLRDGCAAPTNLQVAPAPTWATATWTSDNNNFDLRYIAADAASAGMLIYDFEDGTLGNWTTIDADGDSYVWQPNTTFGGHNGSTGIVYSQSYTSTTGPLTPDNYLVSPQIALGGSLTFWACAQDASYAAEHFGVAVSTTGNTDEDDFTTIAAWDMTAKNSGNPTSTTRSGNRAQGAWYQYTVDLSAYSGMGYVAIRHFDCTDWFYLNVDDVTINLPGELNWNVVNNIAATTYTMTGLTPETEYILQVRSNCGRETSDWVTTTFTTMEPCPGITHLHASNITPNSATIDWTGYSESYELQYGVVPTAKDPISGDDGWYYYDNGTYGTSIGLGGGAFSWGVMFPAGTYEGDIVSAVSAYNVSNYPMTGSLTIYNDGTSAPENEVGSMDIAFSGANDFTVFQFDTPVSIDPTKNVWVIFYNESGATYPAAASTDVTDDPNGRWVEISGNWYDVAAAGVPGYSWMIRAQFGYGYDPSTIDWVSVPNIENPPYELTGLMPGTTYAVQVRANCGDGTYTDWVIAYFTTPSNCAAPSALASTDVMPDGATLSWTGYQGSYNLRYRTASYREVFFFDDFNDGDADDWTQNDGGVYYFTGDDSDWFVLMGYTSTDTQYLISPELPEFETGSTVEFYHRYNQEATTFKVGFSSTTADVNAFTWGRDITSGSSFALYTWVVPAGTKYIAIQTTAAAAENALLIDDFGIYGPTVAAGSWQTVSATSPYTLEGLANETEYEWQVQGISASCDGGVTDWSESVFFTTLSACAAPYGLTSEVEATSATFNWEGYQNSYNLRYRTSSYADILFYDYFAEGELGDWTAVNLEDGSGAMEGMFAFHWTENPPQYLISPDLSDVLVEGSTLRFLCAAYNEEYPESFMVGYSSTGNAVEDFTWGEEYTITDTDGLYYQELIPDGTKYFAIQCTSDDQYYFIVTDFMIYGPMTPAGDWVYVNGVESPVTVDGLTPETWYEWQVQGVGCGDEDWSDLADFYTPEPTTVTEAIALAAGTNWISANVEITLDDLKAALVESLPGTQITIYSQSNGNTTYNGSRWRGQLTTMDLTQMYMVGVSADCEIALEGMPINPAEHPATVHPGTNWIAFPLNVNMTLTDAFAGFAINGDMVISQSDGYSTYNGVKWRGSLSTLEPIKGYMYKSTATEDKTLIFPTSAKSAPKKMSPKSSQTPLERTFNLPGKK